LLKNTFYYIYVHFTALTTRRSTNTNTIQCNNSATIIGATSDLVHKCVAL